MPENIEFVPVGTVTAFAGPSLPEECGWLECDGSRISRQKYESLFKAIGTCHGSGDGVKTFNLPDYRGRFLRGVDAPASSKRAGAQRDPDASTRTEMNKGGNTGASVGSVQTDAFQGHSHATNAITLSGVSRIANGAFHGSVRPALNGAPVSEGANEEPRTSVETRAKNAYVNYIIRYGEIKKYRKVK